MIGKVFVTLLAAGLCLGCVVDQYGRVRPPDPIGQAIFNALDPATPVYQPQEYAVETDIPALRNERRTVVPVGYSDPVWVKGIGRGQETIGCGCLAAGCNVPARTSSGRTAATTRRMTAVTGVRAIGRKCKIPAVCQRWR